MNPSNAAMLVKAIKKIKGGYSVTLCTPQCDGSSTTHQPTTTGRQQQPTTAPPVQQENKPAEVVHKKGLLGGHHCFSSDMTVTTPTGQKRMDEVRAGDEVLVMTSDSKPIYEPIEWLYHRDPEAVADFVTVTTKSQRTLQLSANHLIPFVPCSNNTLESMDVNSLADSQSFFARRLRVGNCLATVIDNRFIADQIVDIKRESKRGIYSPITSRGTIIVNDMYVSCYSSVENHLIQKTVHAALINARRLVSAAWNSIFGKTLVKEDSNVPMPLQVLLKMAHLILPSNVYNGY